jgi:hypothetical protein
MRKYCIFHIVLLIILMTLLSFCSSGRKEEIFGLNQNIHHDDFEYAVTGFTKADQITYGPDTIKSRCNFYLVHFRVINKALRVGHQWNNSIGYLVDENGNHYENSKDLQKILNKSLFFGWKEMYNTPHGQTDTTILVFDLPAGIKQPFLMVRGEILMGDVLDEGKFKRMKIRLF